METYVQGKGWTTFAKMQAERKSVEAQYDQFDKSRADMRSRMDYLKKLLEMHKKDEPYQKVNAEYWKLKKAEETYSKLTEDEKAKFNGMATHLQKRMKQFVFGNLVEELCEKNY